MVAQHLIFFKNVVQDNYFVADIFNSELYELESELPDELMMAPMPQWGNQADGLSNSSKPHATGPGPGTGGPNVGGGPGGPSGPGGPGGPGGAAVGPQQSVAGSGALQNGAVMEMGGQGPGVSSHPMAHHLQIQQQVCLNQHS